jgi:molybdopterin adenylyltransferase
LEILVLTISDRASRGVYADESGPAIERILRERFPDAGIARRIVADEISEIVETFKNSLHCDFILTTGGTGLSSRDVTPEATASFCDRLIPGIVEILRAESWKQTPQAMLSRGTAGQKGKTLLVNFPGSVKAAEFCTRLLLPVMEHAQRMISGNGHERGR